MANKLSFTVAVSVLMDNLGKIANSVKTVFKNMQTDVSGFVTSLWTMVREWDAVAMEMLTKQKANEAKLTQATAQRVSAQNALENAQLQYSVATGERKLKAAEQVAYREILYNKAVLDEEKAALAVQASNSAARIGMGTRAINTLRVGAGKLVGTLKGMWASLIPGIVITGITSVINHFRQLYTESKRIKNIFSDYKKEIDKTTTSVESIKLDTLLTVANNLKQTDLVRNAAWKELASIMDLVRQKGETELDFNQRITNEVKKRLELIKEEAKVETLLAQSAHAKDRIIKLQNEANLDVLSDGAFTNIISRPESHDRIKEYAYYKSKFNIKHVDGYENKLNELHVLYNSLEFINNNLATATANVLSLKPQTDLLPSPEISVGNFQLKDIATDKEFSKGYLSEEAPSLNTELENIQKTYEADLLKLDNQLKAGTLSQKSYNEALQALLNNTITLSASLLGGEAEANEFFAGLLSKRMDIALPERQKRDTTFDYRKTNLEINKEELDIAEKYLSDFKSAVDEGAKFAQEQLNEAMGNVTNLKDAIKIAEVKEEIKQLQNELGEGFYSGLKSMVSDSDRMVNSFKNLGQVMSSVDASGWERMMAVWNAFTTTADSFLSVIKLVEQLTAVSERLSQARQVEAAIDSQVTGQKVANASTAMAADLSAASVKKATATQELAADTAVAAGSAGKSAARLPFPFNLVAIGAAIAGVLALFASIPKFAYGGIVGGNSFAGDKILARLNSGEMVLNPRQQSRLFGMLNTGEKSVTKKEDREKVEFKIEGTTLIGVLNNTNKRLSKFK